MSTGSIWPPVSSRCIEAACSDQMNLTAEFINRTLDRETWARDRLAAHAGRTLRLVVGPARIDYAIDHSGRLLDAAAAPDLTLTISPLRLPGLRCHLFLVCRTCCCATIPRMKQCLWRRP